MPQLFFFYFYFFCIFVHIFSTEKQPFEWLSVTDLCPGFSKNMTSSLGKHFWNFLNVWPKKRRLQSWWPLPLLTCTALALRKLLHQFSRSISRNPTGCHTCRLFTGTQSLLLRLEWMEGLNMEDWKRREQRQKGKKKKTTWPRYVKIIRAALWTAGHLESATANIQLLHEIQKTKMSFLIFSFPSSSSYFSPPSSCNVSTSVQCHSTEFSCCATLFRHISDWNKKSEFSICCNKIVSLLLLSSVPPDLWPPYHGLQPEQQDALQPLPWPAGAAVTGTARLHTNTHEKTFSRTFPLKKLIEMMSWTRSVLLSAQPMTG